MAPRAGSLTVVSRLLCLPLCVQLLVVTSRSWSGDGAHTGLKLSGVSMLTADAGVGRHIAPREGKALREEGDEGSARGVCMTPMLAAARMAAEGEEGDGWTDGCSSSRCCWACKKPSCAQWEAS
jgi:hypothetical protein